MIVPTCNLRNLSAFCVSLKIVILLDVNQLQIWYTETLMYLENKLVFYTRFYIGCSYFCCIIHIHSNNLNI
jgi:hypothetical protein